MHNYKLFSSIKCDPSISLNYMMYRMLEKIEYFIDWCQKNKKVGLNVSRIYFHMYTHQLLSSIKSDPSISLSVCQHLNTGYCNNISVCITYFCSYIGTFQLFYSRIPLIRTLGNSDNRFVVWSFCPSQISHIRKVVWICCLPFWGFELTGLYCTLKCTQPMPSWMPWWRPEFCTSKYEFEVNCLFHP